MTLTSHRPCFADTMGLPVVYHGKNPQGLFMFANGGGPLVTDLYATLEEAVERFGSRIEKGDKSMQFSGPYIAGLAAAMARQSHAPDTRQGKQAVLEYGTGYLRGMLERPAVKIVEAGSPALPVPNAIEPAAGWDTSDEEEGF